MNRRDIVIGLAVLAVLGAFVYFRQRRVDEEDQLKVPQTLSIEDRLEDAFNMEVPEDVEKAELKDVSGGDGSGLATRKYEAGRFTHTVLADLPEPAAGSFYEGWLVSDSDVISTGRLRVAKGGYLLEFTSTTDYSDYNEVVVTQEKKADQLPETHVLEGNF